MQIRAELPGDHEAVLTVNRRAFGGSGDKVAGLVQALRAADPAGLSLVAVADTAETDTAETDTVVGHLMVTPTLLDAPRRLVSVQVVSPLAVAPQWQRRGVGSALLRHGMHLLDKREVPLVWLEGDPAYYAQRGFEPGGDRGFRKPSLRIPDPAFQVMTLSAYEPWMTGTLVYSAPFWEHDCVGLRDSDA